MGQVVRIVPGGVSFEPGRKLVKAGDYQVFLDARALVEDAEAEAERIRAAAKTAYAEEKLRGYDDGHREAEKDMAEKVHDVFVTAADYYTGVESTMVRLVADGVRSVIGEIDEAELVPRTVRNALTLVRNQARVTLRVPPAQEQLVRSRLDELLTGLHGISYVDVVPDGRLGKGDCVLESDVGIIEANLDTQLAALESSLNKYMSVAKRPDPARGLGILASAGATDMTDPADGGPHAEGDVTAADSEDGRVDKQSARR